MKQILFTGLVLAVALVFAARPAAAQDFGKTLTGKVILSGDKAPERGKVDVTKDQAHCLSKGPILSEDWVVNPKNQGVKDVFVWLEPVNGAEMPVHEKLKNAPPKSHKMDQPCCMFEPHALVLRAGDTLEAHNGAPIPHNYRWSGHPLINPGGNIAMAPGANHKIDNLKADAKFPIKVNCDIHPWMGAWVRVFDHPYATLTNADGTFTMDLPPAGEYKLKIWHPASGWLGGATGREGYPVTIKGNGAETDSGSWKLEKAS